MDAQAAAEIPTGEVGKWAQELATVIKGLEEQQAAMAERLGSVLSAPEGKTTEATGKDVPQIELCELAARLRNFTYRLGGQVNDWRNLCERVEL